MLLLRHAGKRPVMENMPSLQGRDQYLRRLHRLRRVQEALKPYGNIFKLAGEAAASPALLLILAGFENALL